MANKNPIDPKAAKAAAQAATATAADQAVPKPLSFDPTIGEQALLTCKPALLAMTTPEVLLPNCDVVQSAAAAKVLVDVIRSPRFASKFALLPEPVMGEATADSLETHAQALFFLETRVRTKVASSNEIRVDPELLATAVEVRDRMLRVLAYHFEKNPPIKAEIADIRLGSGYADLASDLARVATHYSTHRAILEKDTFQYEFADEDLARGISNEIMAALQSVADTSLNDLRNRCWTKLLRIYTKLRAAGELLFIDSPNDLVSFPPLRQAVIAVTSRGRATEKVDPAAPVSPGTPVAPVAPAAPIVSAPVTGTGPGGSPLI